MLSSVDKDTPEKNIQSNFIIYCFKSEEEGNNQEEIQSNTTPDPGHHIGKWQNTQENMTHSGAFIVIHLFFNISLNDILYRACIHVCTIVLIVLSRIPHMGHKQTQRDRNATECVISPGRIVFYHKSLILQPK